MPNTINQTIPRQFGLSTGNLLPARLDAKQTGQILGFQEHDIPVLVKNGLLDPLGKPQDNARKYFALVNIMERADDPAWLGKATKIVSQNWIDKNASRKSNIAADESIESSLSE